MEKSEYPKVWVVIGKRGPEFVAGWPELAHEHANDLSGISPEEGPYRVAEYWPMKA